MTALDERSGADVHDDDSSSTAGSQASPRTVLRAEVVDDAPVPLVARASRDWPPLLGRALIAIALLLVWALAYVFLLSGFTASRAQQNLYDQLRSELAGLTAPVAEPIALGAPIALLNAPAGGLRDLVVVEGTSAQQLDDGPGHLRSSALPGQSGITVLMGRSTTFGGPFAGVDDLRPGDVVTVTTGQGTFRYTVKDRRTNGGVLRVPADTRAVLTLITSRGTGALAGLAPASTVYVDAVLTGTPRTAEGTADRPGPSELPMRNDHTFATLAELVLALQLLAATLAATVWAGRRWSPTLIRALGVPMVIASLWYASEVASRLLPNLM